jgi:hypothetical protein
MKYEGSGKYEGNGKWGREYRLEISGAVYFWYE